MNDFYFNKKTQRYHYATGKEKGRFISYEKVRGLVREYLNSQKQAFDFVSDQLFNGEISLAEWEKNLAQTIKTLSIQLYKIGKPTMGENPQDDFRDYGRIGANLRSEYAYLRAFTAQIAEGELSEAQIRARARQYIEGTYWNFEQGRRESHKEGLWVWERRRLSPAEHCPDCPRYASQGWVPLGTLPGIGQQCRCLSNCKCFFEFSKSPIRPTQQNAMILNKSGWLP